MSIAVNKKRRWQHNYRRWVIDWDNAPPWMNQPWKVIHIRNEVFPECFDYFRAREGSCHTPSTNGSSGCSGDFWQRITTLNSEQITPPAGSKRIVAGLCTWQCHVNVIHELKKKICQVFILPEYHQKVVNIQVFGHVQHSCNGFSLCNWGRPLHIAEGLLIQWWVTAKDNTKKNKNPPYNYCSDIANQRYCGLVFQQLCNSM